MAGTRGEDAAGLRMLPAGSVTAPALRGLSRFADSRGIPASWEFLLDYDVIEAFCVAGLAGRAPATRGTYRSALYRLAEARHGPPGPRATPFPGARAPAPYSPGERAELAALAAAQRDPAKRASALALVVFGIGAGLRPGELVALRGGDVTRHGRRVTVHVSGPSARVVPVTADYPAAPGSWPDVRAAGMCSAPARPIAAIRTSSPISPCWLCQPHLAPPTTLIRPHLGAVVALAGRDCSTLIWPRLGVRAWAAGRCRWWRW